MKRLHQKMDRLRNSAVAHVDWSDEEWTKEGVVLRLRDEGPKIFAPNSRFNYHGQMTLELSALISVSEDIVRAMREENEQAIYREFDPLWFSDDHFVDVLTQCPFDKIAFFGWDNPDWDADLHRVGGSPLPSQHWKMPGTPSNPGDQSI